MVRGHSLTQAYMKGQQQVPAGARSEPCPCESCLFLKSAVGKYLLSWASDFIHDVVAKVKTGQYSRDTKLVLQFKPDGGGPSTDLEMTVDDLLKGGQSPILNFPDLSLIREQYPDDPVIKGLVDWLERRRSIL